MGLFSRKDKLLPSPPADDLTPSPSHASLHSTGAASSGLQSPLSSTTTSSSSNNLHALANITVHTMNTNNRSSAGTAGTSTSSVSGGGPGTPLTPFSATTSHQSQYARSPDPALDPAGYLRSLPAIRERSRIIGDKALRNELAHFDVDMSKFADVTSFVAQIIKRDYDLPYTTHIPPHSRYQHFSIGGRDRIALLLATWPANEVNTTERCRRLIDLFVVSVLLDAGAGTEWKYTSHENKRVYRRSEGLAIASLDMFKAGLFSSHPHSNRTQADKDGLKALTVAALAKGLQSTEGNAIAGLEGRASLLIRLGDALAAHPEIYGPEGRPGNMVDYLVAHPSTQASSKPIVMVTVLWNLLMDSLATVWPDARTAVNGVSLGDAWPCSDMPQPASAKAQRHSKQRSSASQSSSPSTKTRSTFSPFPPTSTSSSSSPSAGPVEAWEAIVPFHKLTQWLTYSLMQPMQSLLKVHFEGTELLTGLPEYRNGGLFIDMGVLNLKQEEVERGLTHFHEYSTRKHTSGVEVAPMFDQGDDVVVEWRAVTVCFLDKLCADVNQALHTELQGQELTLAQLLEAGSWKGGREIAEMSRPNTKEPPILIDSDGTVF